MRERAITTSVIWVALAASIDMIVGSIHELTYPGWQIGAAVLVFVLTIAAGAATVAIWQSAVQQTDRALNQQAEKAKRDQRDARIKRLLATMDDEQLDALEDQRLGDGERLSLEALLRKHD